MKIALVGYGNMGKEIAQLVSKSKNHSIVSVSYTADRKGLDITGIKKADVAIDFTSQEVIIENIERISSLGIALVVGTTGWFDNIDYIKQVVKKKNIGFVYGQNFSIGANVFFHIIRYSSRLLSSFPGYDIYGYEIHHKGKKDSPSGTAKKIAEIVLQNYQQKTSLQPEKLDRQILPEEFHFASIRGGRNPGEHTVTFDSMSDAITLSEHAHNRRGFAEGAVLAASFIKNKKGFFTFDEVFAKQVEKI